ncbi:unnamed protein product, partial [Menidia menidia]
VQVGGPEAQPELSVQQPELSGAAHEPQLSHAVQEAQVSGDVQEPQVSSYNSAWVAALVALTSRQRIIRNVMISAGSLKGKKRDLLDNIQAATGVRVMIVRNLDVEDGMVKGTL